MKQNRVAVHSNNRPRPGSVQTRLPDEVRLPEMLFGYLAGPFGALLANGIFACVLNKYLTDVLRLDTGFLSRLQLFSTVPIVAANLLVGQLIEHTRVMTGKARPWILFSALTLSVGSVLMFVMPFDGPARRVWIAVAYHAFYAVAFPIYNTANAALVSVSTRDSAKRSTLASLTTIANLCVMLVASVGFPVLVSNVLHENLSRWFFAMTVVGGFAAMTILLQYRFTRERITEEVRGHTDAGQKNIAPSVGAQLKAAMREKWWWIAILFHICYQWSNALKNGSAVYFCQWVADLSPVGGDYGAVQSLLALLGAAPMVVVAIFVVPLARRFGKRRLVFWGMVISVAGGLIVGAGGGNLMVVGIGTVIKCFGAGPAAFLTLAMLTDVVDYIEYQSGLRTDGLTMSIYSALMVAGTPICNAVFMALMRGYDAALAVQSAEVQRVIVFSYIWVENIAYLAGAVLIYLWTAEKTLAEERVGKVPS